MSVDSIRRSRRETWSSSGWDAFLDCLQHLVGKDIDLLYGCVDVRCDANSPELRMHNRRIHDPVLVEQPGAELPVGRPLPLEPARPARLSAVEWSEDFDARAFLDQPLR